MKFSLKYCLFTIFLLSSRLPLYSTQEEESGNEETEVVTTTDELIPQEPGETTTIIDAIASDETVSATAEAEAVAETGSETTTISQLPECPKSDFGCCPDQLTPSLGPDNEGCPPTTDDVSESSKPEVLPESEPSVDEKPSEEPVAPTLDEGKPPEEVVLDSANVDDDKPPEMVADSANVDEEKPPEVVEDPGNVDEEKPPEVVEDSANVDEGKSPEEVVANPANVDEEKPPEVVEEPAKLDEEKPPEVVEEPVKVDEENPSEVVEEPAKVDEEKPPEVVEDSATVDEGKSPEEVVADPAKVDEEKPSEVVEDSANVDDGKPIDPPQNPPEITTQVSIEMEEQPTPQPDEPVEAVEPDKSEEPTTHSTLEQSMEDGETTMHTNDEVMTSQTEPETTTGNKCVDNDLSCSTVVTTQPTTQEVPESGSPDQEDPEANKPEGSEAEFRSDTQNTDNPSENVEDTGKDEQPQEAKEDNESTEGDKPEEDGTVKATEPEPQPDPPSTDENNKIVDTDQPDSTTQESAPDSEEYKPTEENVEELDEKPVEEDVPTEPPTLPEQETTEQSEPKPEENVVSSDEDKPDEGPIEEVTTQFTVEEETSENTGAVTNPSIIAFFGEVPSATEQEYETFTTTEPAECLKSDFGCCPDQSTPARGPNNEGCPCESLPNGCCPDRMTPAQGANNEGCPCPTMPYGCCPNSTKPAVGPFFAGCICSEAPHGCCADGITVAYGPNFAGCKDGPPLDTRLAAKACALPKDRGTCRNYTVKWTYDMEYGGCIRFWYGGCEGNANRFQSQEECDRICVSPEGTEACDLPKVEGPCEGHYSSYYFNSGSGKCEQFVYGGCLGNKNRFDTIEACEQLCLTKSASPSKDPCEQPAKPGPCRGNFRRWYFDKAYGRCRTFTYGGCQGNDNNFEMETDCQKTCGSASPKELCILPKAEGPCLGNYPRYYYDYVDGVCKDFIYTGCEGNRNRFVDKTSCEKMCNHTKVDTSEDICVLPVDSGPCRGAMPRWYFDTREGRCKQFYYGGCNGNANKFERRIDCERACVTTAKKEENVCVLKKEVGNCVSPYYKFEEKWYFDTNDHQCHRFHFSGCGGNGNNFRSLEDCQQRCGQPVTPLLAPYQRRMDETSVVVPFSVDHCKLPKDHGPCYHHDVRYWYDSRDGVCKEFYYGGCGGNNNRFSTRKDCERNCWNSQDICRLPKIRGSCNGNFVQWYYDTVYDACMPFNYSLCNGNANRFSQKEACELQCKRGSLRSSTEVLIEPQPDDSSGTNIISRDPRCSLAVDPGTGRQYISMFYYNAHENICRSFIWTGEGGNNNRFDSRIECETQCVSVSQDEDISMEERETVCRLNNHPGHCGSSMARWFYDPSTFSCQPFVWSGCGGNKNRFKTFETCQKFCKGISNLTPEGAIVVHFPDEDRREEAPNRSPLDPYADRNPAEGLESVNGDRNPIIPFVPPTTTSTTPSTTTARDFCKFECSDSPFFADCELLVRGKFCQNEYYLKFCCKSCLSSQQIDMEKVKTVIIGDVDITKYETVDEGHRLCFFESDNHV